MAPKLKKYFPMIREREEVLAEIMGTEALQMKYTSWSTEDRVSVSGKKVRLLFGGSVAAAI